MIRRYFILLDGHWEEVSSCSGKEWFATVQDEAIIIKKQGSEGYALYDVASGKHYIDCAVAEEVDTEELQTHLDHFIEFCTQLVED